MIIKFIVCVMMTICIYMSNFLYIFLRLLLSLIVLTFLGLIAVAQGKNTHYGNHKTRSTQPHKQSQIRLPTPAVPNVISSHR